VARLLYGSSRLLAKRMVATGSVAKTRGQIG
jgi:hypothetical protein